MRRPPSADERAIDVVVVGEINPDIIVSDPDPAPRFGQQERIVESVTFTLGSSSVIAACGMARLGLRVAMVGVVGDDPFGRYMLDAMRERAIDTSACRVDPALPTGASVILANQSDRAILTAPGTIAEVRAADVPDYLLAGTRHVHVGSYFIQTALQPALPELFETAHAHGATTSLDSNDDPTGRWNSGLTDALAETDLFFPNENEARAIARIDDALTAGTRLASGDRSPIVAIKLGQDGAAAAVDGKVIAQVAAYPVDLVDAVGAGDSFDAGFISAWLDGAPLDRCLRLGAVCGALSSRAIGGTSGQPTRAEAYDAERGWT
jgi:sugar/nucleoside kinase (ribokinase family)